MTQAAEAARTVILTVDDDPGVSRAVARDLRRRYGGSYRVVRAESGESALEALREGLREGIVAGETRGRDAFEAVVNDVIELPE
ncbi:hypothetical protein ABT329_39680, partial [Streptomyces minutiscleroticus]